MPQLDAHGPGCACTIVRSPTLLSYEEFHPFGSSAYRAANSAIDVSAKRYRYIGKERDEETGLYHMGARYYAAWLGRWTAADPLGLVDGPNRYVYSRDNPVRLKDPSGTNTGALGPPADEAHVASGIAEAPGHDPATGEIKREITVPELTKEERAEILAKDPELREIALGLRPGSLRQQLAFEKGEVARIREEAGAKEAAVKADIERAETEAAARQILQAGEAIEQIAIAEAGLLTGAFATGGLAGLGVRALLAEAAGGGVAGVVQGTGEALREGATAGEAIEQGVVTGAIGAATATGLGLVSRGIGAVVSKLRGGGAPAPGIEPGRPATGGAEPVRVGQAGERAVRAKFDIGDKVKIPINGRNRIPDGLTPEVLSEVKNVKSLSFTRQLRDFADFARQTERRFDVYVRPDTELSGPLLQAVEDKVINLLFIP